jgi:hypothetical protein
MYNSKSKNKRRQYLKYIRQKQSQLGDLKINPNKKKIRNWPVLVKRLGEMKNQYLCDDAQVLKQCLIDNRSYIDMKLYIDPFYRLEKRNPPIWYRKLFVAALMDVYANWKSLADSFSEDYYLKIWVFESNFYDSQVVLGIRERIDRFQGLFDQYDDNIDFPHEKYSHVQIGSDTKKIHWEIKKNVSFYNEDDLLDIPKKYLQNKIDNDQAWLINDEVYGKLMVIHDGDVWVGA